jgi:pyridoxine 5-phosphate synthase
LEEEMKLGVNLDHIATIREMRKTVEPDPVQAAIFAELGGADCITVHLREDRRHIKERDINLLKETIKVPLNLEMSILEDIVEFALSVKPYEATLVPERREEITTEGGLDVMKSKKMIHNVIKKLKEKDTKVNLFIDPEEKQIEASKYTEADGIEIHTGGYANAKGKEKTKELENIERCAAFAKKIGLEVHAGHGLTYLNVQPVASIREIVELHIGHSIISRSIFIGLKEAVKEMKNLINEARILNRY